LIERELDESLEHYDGPRSAGKLHANGNALQHAAMA
jgi:hypothetical protein